MKIDNGKLKILTGSGITELVAENATTEVCFKEFMRRYPKKEELIIICQSLHTNKFVSKKLKERLHKCQNADVLQ